MFKKGRRTLKHISYYPSPTEIYEAIMRGEGWDYKVNAELYRLRDRALVALTYLLGARISEVLKLRKSQFVLGKSAIIVRGIELSKRRWKGKPRREQYRQEAWLPLKGERAPLTVIVLEYLKTLNGEDAKLFNFGRVRAWQIISRTLKVPCHWLRAYCENYLYDKWRKDLLAVSDYIKVDPRTLSLYIRGSYRKYKAV